MQELFEAIQKADITSCRRLLDEDPSRAASRNGQGVSARLMALYCQQEEIAQLLATQGPAPDLLEAAALGDTTRLAIFSAAGDDLSQFSADGFSALHLSAFFGRREVAQHLLQQGAKANVEATNGSGLHPLNSAVAGGHLEIVRLLLEHGADINAAQAGGVTPVMGAAAGGHREVLELLLAQGADTARLSDDGHSAADYANERGHQELLPLLGSTSDS